MSHENRFNKVLGGTLCVGGGEAAWISIINGDAIQMALAALLLVGGKKVWSLPPSQPTKESGSR